MAKQFVFFKPKKRDTIEVIQLDVLPQTIAFADKYQKNGYTRLEEETPTLKKDGFVFRVLFQSSEKKKERKRMAAVLDAYLAIINEINHVYQTMAMTQAVYNQVEAPLPLPPLRFAHEDNLVSITFDVDNKDYFQKLFEVHKTQKVSWNGLQREGLDMDDGFDLELLLKKLDFLPEKWHWSDSWCIAHS